MKGFLDIETGGFSITKNGICEIALIAVNNQHEVVAKFHTLIKPYRREEGDELVSYKEDSMAINGLTVEKLLAEGQDVVSAVYALKYFIEQNNIETIVGHNSDVFDIPRVEYLLNRFAQFSIADKIKLDTMRMAKEKLSLPSYKLEDLCEYFGIINDQQHSAVGDATATLELYIKLLQL